MWHAIADSPRNSTHTRTTTMSKKKSKKVFQVPIQEIPEWNRQLAFDGLIGACRAHSALIKAETIR